MRNIGRYLLKLLAKKNLNFARSLFFECERRVTELITKQDIAAFLKEEGMAVVSAGFMKKTVKCSS